jgi:16S rRNA (cytosine967-C5)-methyltransferase
MCSALSAPSLATLLRHAAVLLAGVFDGSTPDAALARLDERLRPGVSDLLLSTLRDYGRGDFLLGRLLRAPLGAGSAVQTQQLRALLLILLHRLETRPEGAHTTVDQGVEAARVIAGPRVVGLVNAVLRRFLRERETLLAAAAADPVAHGSHPAWWLQALQADHPHDWEAIVAAGNTHPPMSLRINRRLTSADFQATLATTLADLRTLPNGALKLASPLPVARVPGFAEGLCSVQDAGAQWAAQLLDVHDGQRVLDACSAPGGKTAHLLELATLDLLALELDAERLQRVERNLERLKLTATLRLGDARQVKHWWDGQPFDRILADVPCSASGVVRRHPDAKWLRRPEDIASFATQQREIIDALWPTLAPGGKMLYATCSVFAAENALQIEAFLARHADAQPIPAPAWPTTADPPFMPLPPTADHDGFFYALLHKRT